MSDKWEIWKAQLRSIIQAHYRLSVMNNAKWEEVKEVLRTLQLVYRVKLVTGPDISQWSIAGLYEPANFIDFHGPVHVLEIEWLEANPHHHVPRPYVGPDRYIDYSAEVEQQFRQLGVPFSIEHGMYRIWGHIPHNVYPNFAE
ncbi:MAG TPA: DUF6678 family protein [Herpetosiphonaceae bacterium]